MDQPAFGRRLRQLRLERGIKQTELAGGPVSASYISRLEMGNRLPSAQTLSYLATTLGVSLAALLAPEPPGLPELPEQPGPSAAAAGRTALAVPCAAGRCGGDAPVPARGPLLAEAAAALRDGDGRRVVDLLEPVADLVDGVPFGWGWHLLWLLAEAYGTEGRPVARVEVLRTLAECSAAWAGPGVDTARAGLLAELSVGERTIGRLAAALENGERAVGLSHRAPAAERVRALMALAAAEAEAGLLYRAAGRIPELLLLADEVVPRLAAQAYWTCAGLRGREGRTEESDRLMDRSLASLDSRDDLAGWARLRTAAGALRLRSGRTDGVEALIEQAQRAVDLVGSPGQMAVLFFLRAWLCWAEGAYDSALSYVAEAQRTGLLTFHDRLRAGLLRSRCLLALGAEAEGRTALRAVAVEAEDAGYLDLATEAWKALAAALDPA
ncbi:helix-turn-helix domain-containing protein [Kitasatospora saccharophila]|uniref:helix-turn-helix domain-containing protein n=1 Tax=Kitasatospora saccharophila TaxID=407973 RepID=UPI0031D059C5